eukprot:1034393-Prymnesium_polylepis.1
MKYNGMSTHSICWHKLGARHTSASADGEATAMGRAMPIEWGRTRRENGIHESTQPGGEGWRNGGVPGF